VDLAFMYYCTYCRALAVLEEWADRDADPAASETGITRSVFLHHDPTGKLIGSTAVGPRGRAAPGDIHKSVTFRKNERGAIVGLDVVERPYTNGNGQHP
jgi:hypothetical protein